MCRWSFIASMVAIAVICSQAVEPMGAAGACIKSEKATIAEGRAPGGTPWSIGASIEARGSCNRWHLGFGFESKEFGYSEADATVSAGIPSGQLQVEASDIRNRAGTATAFFGYVPTNAKEVLAVAKTGQRFVVRPRSVSARKVKGRNWLRRFRYFVFFHSGGSRIEHLSVIGPGGEVLESAENQGLFFS
jgi:hypothetical protein